MVSEPEDMVVMRFYCQHWDWGILYSLFSILFSILFPGPRSQVPGPKSQVPSPKSQVPSPNPSRLTKDGEKNISVFLLQTLNTSFDNVSDLFVPSSGHNVNMD